MSPFVLYNMLGLGGMVLENGSCEVKTGIGGEA